jgi:choline dehydrogenase-like flavoprotein
LPDDTRLRDFLIVGAGPAGAAAALQLAGEDVVMLDVGDTPAPVPSRLIGDLAALRQGAEDLFPLLIGDAYQSLSNLTSSRKRNLKLKAPFLDYIVGRTGELTPVVCDEFAGDLSLAKGGLANAWGAGLYRFTDEDLAGFPIRYADLCPFFDVLTGHIGICGAQDDLLPWFLRDGALLPPLAISRLARTVLARYESRRARFHAAGIHIGRGRLGVLTQAHRGRQPYAYENQEFFRPENPAVYTPAYTIDELRKTQSLDYQPGHLVVRFRQEPDAVAVEARRVDTNEIRTFRARHVLLAAGAINTARIALSSRDDFETRLPLLDNPLTAFPLFGLSLLGSAPDPLAASVTQLNVLYTGNPEAGTIQASFYNANGSLRSDIIADLPVPLALGRQLVKHLSSCLGVLMCFYPGTATERTYVKLAAGNAVELAFDSHTFGPVESALLAAFRRIGFLGHKAFVVAAGKGSGLHYAGTLPMVAEPRTPYQCAPDGRLNETTSVFVADAAGFSALPAKNLSLTSMANAMRVASHLMR